jgi:hypothetical protein
MFHGPVEGKLICVGILYYGKVLFQNIKKYDF